jgi:hypothetical protein
MSTQQEKKEEKRNPLEIPKGINKRCDLPPEAYWVRFCLRTWLTPAVLTLSPAR